MPAKPHPKFHRPTSGQIAGPTWRSQLARAELIRLENERNTTTGPRKPGRGRPNAKRKLGRFI